MSEKLLPCPFCGVPAHQHCAEHSYGNVHSISCGNDDCSVGCETSSGDADEAITAWNTRAGSGDPAPQTPELPAQRRWLNDLIKAAEAFRVAMIQSGATVKVSQDLYFDQLRALERALNPMNYRDDAGQQSAATNAGPMADLRHKVLQHIATYSADGHGCRVPDAWIGEANRSVADGQSVHDSRGRRLTERGVRDLAAHTTSPEPDAVNDLDDVMRVSLVWLKRYQCDDDLSEAECFQLETAIANLTAALSRPAHGGWPDKLPCDVKLPPVTTIRKGCDLKTLFAAFKVRANWSDDESRFPDAPTLPRNQGQGGGPR